MTDKKYKKRYRCNGKNRAHHTQPIVQYSYIFLNPTRPANTVNILYEHIWHRNRHVPLQLLQPYCPKGNLKFRNLT